MLIYADDTACQGLEDKPIVYPDLQPVNTKTILKRRALRLNVEPVHLLAQINKIASEIVSEIYSRNSNLKKSEDFQVEVEEDKELKRRWEDDDQDEKAWRKRSSFGTMDWY
eukprot:TRINITY_DN9222_c0_g1_i2.p1 TRINITY_DN9222_c0_g1~~TRINITY_DN9222_c0_g1_i2.p1  ORF type:complete len:111 (-),score=46.50 TRINITY_DN9222_c0_g1_i2:23-355(-)